MADDHKLDAATGDPRHPPHSVVNSGVRRAALWAYVGPIVVLALVVAFAFVYWARRPEGRTGAPNELRPEIGTTGEQQRGGERDTPSTRQQGGGDPAPRPDSSREELRDRGVGGQGDSLRAPGLERGRDGQDRPSGR